MSKKDPLSCMKKGFHKITQDVGGFFDKIEKDHKKNREKRAGELDREIEIARKEAELEKEKLKMRRLKEKDSNDPFSFRM